MKKLADFAADVYSQFGEDGIIEKIFEIIGEGGKLCVEFGAWDGFHLSNTANLWANHGWRGVLIEGKEKRFKQLQKNVRSYDCSCICAYVEREGNRSLESLLEDAGINDQIDLLSIDIDGNDYYIFEGLQSIRPRVVICEYNPTIPAEIDLVAEEGNYFGCSVGALDRVAADKGYRLVAVTETNCFFVLEEYVALFADYELRLEKIKNDRYVSYFITSYAGEFVLSKTELAYGATFPYTGGLKGEFTRIRVPCRFLRPVYLLLRRLKSQLRDLRS